MGDEGMINSATALKLIKTAPICTIIEDRDHLAVGWGIYANDLRMWMAQKGFRVDTTRSTYVRWTETWMMTGELIPIRVGNSTIAYWFAEVTRNIATQVTVHGDKENLQSIYSLATGLVSQTTMETLGINWGGFF